MDFYSKSRSFCGSLGRDSDKHRLPTNVKGSLVQTTLIQVREAFLKSTMNACAPFEIEGSLCMYEEARRRVTGDFTKPLVHEMPCQRLSQLSVCGSSGARTHDPDLSDGLHVHQAFRKMGETQFREFLHGDEYCLLLLVVKIRSLRLCSEGCSVLFCGRGCRRGLWM